jgi:hypothetical protein
MTLLLLFLRAVGVTFKDLKPQPIPLHPGSPKSLFSSVFYFQSTLNRTKDWSWPSDATPKRMDHWLVLDQRSAAGRPQLWVPEDKVADGWYNLMVCHTHVLRYRTAVPHCSDCSCHGPDDAAAVACLATEYTAELMNLTALCVACWVTVLRQAWCTMLT